MQTGFPGACRGFRHGGRLLQVLHGIELLRGDPLPVAVTLLIQGEGGLGHSSPVGVLPPLVMDELVGDGVLVGIVLQDDLGRVHAGLPSHVVAGCVGSCIPFHDDDAAVLH